MKTNLDLEMKELKEKFYIIQCRNWVPSVGKGNSASGRTLEHLLGKKEDQKSLPDYLSFEIKTKSHSQKYPIHLFSMAPDNKPLELQRMLKLYGYPSRLDKNYHVLFMSVYANKINKVGVSFAYRLKVSYKMEKVILLVYQNNEVIDEDISWSFKELRSRIFHKLNYLALVHARKYTINEQDYFKYEDITFFALKSFSVFLKLIEQGIIFMTFKLSFYRSEEKYGMINDKGTSFCIMESDLPMLYQILES